MTPRDNTWTADQLLDLARQYQAAAVLAAAADLDLFSALESRPATAASLARARSCDHRGLTTLLDALAALGLLSKHDDSYAVPPGLGRFLVAASPDSVLPMLQHQANCLRAWSRLSEAVASGQPVPKTASIRGVAGDQEAFIGAMHAISQPVADQVVAALAPLRFTHLLDVGGASGTWTMAFLRACPTATATLFDLPHVIPLARSRLTEAGFAERVRTVAGDFYSDPLPPGADLVWISAVIHQNSRQQNRALFSKVRAAIQPRGRVAIRDIVMEPDRLHPLAGALFAINMLVATPGGGTYTFEEIREDLQSSGFSEVTLARRDEAMNSIVLATATS